MKLSRGKRMKRSRSEVIRGTLNNYLRRRNYPDAEESTAANSVPCSPEEMAVNSAIERVVSRPNSFLISTINTDVNLAEQHFLRLKNWIAELKQETFQCELASLLCPLFCHLYLEMLCGGHRQTASKFFKRHQGLFTREHNRELLEELASITSSQDIENSTLVKDFRCCKYHVKLSEPAMSCLQMYLAECSHTVLIQLLQDRFSLEVDGTIIPIDGENDKDDAEDDSDSTKKDSKNESDSGDVEDDLRAVREAINEAYNEPTSPAVVLYTISSCEEVTPCGTFTKKLDKLAVGMGSAIKLYSLTNKKLPVPKKHTIYPEFVLGTDDEDDEEEEKNECKESDVVDLFGHHKQVQGLKFVNEDKSDPLLLSVSHDTTMRCWRLDENSCVAIYRGHNGGIWSLDVDSLGLFAVTGSSDYTAKVWALDRTYFLRVLIGHTQDVESVSYHPSCKYIATGSTDKTVRLWTVSEGRLIRIYAGHRGAVQAVRCSPNGKYIASAGEDKRIKIWDIPSANVITEFKGHSGCVVDLSWTPDSEYLASCSLDGTIRQWCVTRGLVKEEPTAEIYEPEPVRHVKVEPQTVTVKTEIDESSSASTVTSGASSCAEASASSGPSSSKAGKSSAPPEPLPPMAIPGPSTSSQTSIPAFHAAPEVPMEATSSSQPHSGVPEPTSETPSPPPSSSISPFQTACFSVRKSILCVHHVSKDTLASVNISYIDD